VSYPLLEESFLSVEQSREERVVECTLEQARLNELQNGRGNPKNDAACHEWKSPKGAQLRVALAAALVSPAVPDCSTRVGSVVRVSCLRGPSSALA
jgi:hypothetical protein